MSAPVAIPATVTPGQTPGASAWARTSATPLVGFEALLAALFPAGQADASGVLAGQVKGGLGLLKGKADAQSGADADAATDPSKTDTSAVQAQLAALLAAQPAQVQIASTSGEPAKPQSAAAPAPAVLPAGAPQPTPAGATAHPETPIAAPPSAALAAASAPPATAQPAADKPALAATPAPPADQPLVLPAAEPKTPPPPVLPAVLPLAQAPAEPAPEAPAQPSTAATAAVAANPALAAGAKPAPREDKPDVQVHAAAPSAEPAPTTLAESAAAAQPAQGSSDGGHDQPPPDQRETASSDQGAPDITAGPTTGPASAAHMIQAEAAAVAARGSPETVAKLAAQIVKKLDGKSSRFDIALDPAGLGKVDVKVEINAQGQMTAALNFDSAAAAAELRNRAGELRTALEQAGFDMSNGNLSFSFSGQGDNSGQAFAQRDGQGGGGARFLQALADDQPVAGLDSTSSLLGSRTSGVDVRI